MCLFPKWKWHIYVILLGGNILHVIDVKNVTSPKILHHMEIDHVDLTDIEYCGGYIFVSMDNILFKEEGRVVVYRIFSTSELMVEKYNITGEYYSMVLTINISVLVYDTARILES